MVLYANPHEEEVHNTYSRFDYQYERIPFGRKNPPLEYSLL